MFARPVGWASHNDHFGGLQQRFTDARSTIAHNPDQGRRHSGDPVWTASVGVIAFRVALKTAGDGLVQCASEP